MPFMSKTRTTKILGFSVPPSMAEEFESLRLKEERTKSELFRAMFRVYKYYRKQGHTDLPELTVEKEARKKAASG